MNIPPFTLERFFARYEFTAKYLLCSSDCEPLGMEELLGWADEKMRAKWSALKLGYTESPGNPILRQEISGLYRHTQAGQVLVVTPEEGIFIAMNTLLGPGDHAICTFPGYQSLYEVARSGGVSISFWKPRWGEGWKFHISDLKKLVQKNTRAIIANFPHNPTGTTVSGEEFSEMIDLAKSRNIVVFSDEMYRFLEHDSRVPLPAACDLYENAVSLSGLSKSFALAGLRIGWLAVRNDVLFKRFASFKDYTTICSSAPSEILAIIGLRSREKILQINRELIHTNLHALDEFFVKYPGMFSWSRPQAGTVAFPALQGARNSREFCDEVLAGTGVLLLPSAEFGFGESHFRIGYARANMREALGKLENYIVRMAQ